jgi:hypothetical protein
MLGRQAGEIIIHWDVARDQTTPVRYDVYRSSNPAFFDSVRYPAVGYESGEGWTSNTGSAYANKLTLEGIPPGTHYFRVRARDGSEGGRQEQNTVTLSIVVPPAATTNSVSNPQANITIDGNLEDWSGAEKFDADPDDVAGANNLADWRSITFAHDSNNIYLAYMNDGPITLNWAYTIYIDTDANSSTGFRWPQAPIGSDHILQGPHVFRYSGDGASWSWSYVGTTVHAVAGESVELALPREWIGNPAAIRFFGVADNFAFAGGNSIDLYPDTALTSGAMPRYFTYECR